MNFAAIDFETATGYRHSACAVAIVTVENGQIVDHFYKLIQPPGNVYWYKNIKVHGITAIDTMHAPLFPDVFPEIARRLQFTTIVAHNEAFDRGVLSHSMEFYGLGDNRIQLLQPWECTAKIYRRKGFKPYNLEACCQRLGIELTHHHALSDALACAKLYLFHLQSANIEI